MANPVNPLDRFKSYTYHFELHVAATREELEDEYAEASEDFTTPSQASGTLLINTRFDAHQTIDNVRYAYIQPRVDPAGVTASIAELSLTVIEPNGSQFIEKLQNVLVDNDVSDLARSCYFLLKIVFVGRNEDNSIEVMPPISIPLFLYDIQAEFTYRGGTYAMLFTGAGAGTISGNYVKNNQISATDGYSNKNVAVAARTVHEALEQLEIALNKNYEDAYQSIKIAGRPIQYKILVDDEIDGSLDLITKESFAPDDVRKIIFQPDIPIVEMIKRIVMSSRDINKRISDSLEGLRKEGLPNVWYPTYSMRYDLTNEYAIITYDVKVYNGDAVAPDDENYEFDFLFAMPPKVNVDVIRFEMKYTTMRGWLQTSLQNSVAWHTNIDNEVGMADGKQYQEIVRPNTKADTYVDQSPQNIALMGLESYPMDVKPMPGSNIRENSGHVQLNHKGAQAARLAFNTVAEMHGSVDPMITFDIRGHYDLLDKHCITTSDGNSINRSPGYGFGQMQPLWVKVNIKRPDPETGGQPYQDFFYTGFYELLSVNSIFEHGQFVQQLTVLMKNRVPDSGAGKRSVPPQSSAQQVPSSSTGESNINGGIVSDTNNSNSNPLVVNGINFGLF